MKKRLLPVLLVLLPFMVGGLCSDSGGAGSDDGDGTGPTSDLDIMQACAVDAVEDYGRILEGLWHVLKETDQPSAYNPPPGVTVNVATGVFEAELDLRDAAGSESELEGTTEPLADCADGMHQGDVCVFEWMVHIPESSDTIARGTYSAIDMGLTTPPNQTTAIRYTISRRETQLLASDECGLIVDGFDMMLRPWDATRPVTSAMINFQTVTPRGTMDGSVIGGATDSLATMTLTYGTQSLECIANLYTWSVDCSQ
jgi:hypothetical protein